VRLRLFPRERRFYELFSAHVANSAEAVAILRVAVDEMTTLPDARRRIKDLEHAGDELTHELVRTLNRTFVTPFDREDIFQLASALDDILDFVDETVELIDLYGIRTVPDVARDLLGYIAAAVTELQRALEKLESQAGVEEHGVEVHRLENLGDEVSRQGIADLFSGVHDPLDVIKFKDLYGILEDTLDRCEDVANIIESITIKNA